MMLAVCLLALVAISCAEESKHFPPKVRVYSYKPGQYGEDNVLICHVSNFHPPDIQIQLMEDKMELPNANQTDLAFKHGWLFHLTKTVVFKPTNGKKYSCKVTHGKTVKDYGWDISM